MRYINSPDAVVEVSHLIRKLGVVASLLSHLIDSVCQTSTVYFSLMIATNFFGSRQIFILEGILYTSSYDT